MSTEVRRVSDFIVCLRRASYQTCSYIVRSTKGLVLIDAGMDSGGAVYVQTIVWKVETGGKLWTIEGHKFDINGLVFTRDNQLLLTGSVDRTIKYWNLKTGTKTRTISMSPN